MPDVTPLAPLVLLVPPEIAAAWESLAPDAQAYWSSMIVHGWLRDILAPRLAPGPPSPVPAALRLMSLEDLRALVADLERHVGWRHPPPEAPAPGATPGGGPGRAPA
jgi:hypothetical protein